MQKRSEQIGVGTIEVSEAEKAYVAEVLASNRLSYGPFSKRFESEFAALHDSKYAVFVNSGTSALSIAVACLKEVHGWQDGDEIIVPALTFVATVNVILEHQLKPVFVDCDPQTYNIDPALIEAKVTDRTRAILPVHLFGLVADMDPILEIASKHNVRVIEDSCETIGVRYKDRKAGSFGDISCFSTYIAHLVVTGVGGLAVTNDPTLAGVLRSLANHGRDGIYVSIDDDKGIDGSQFAEVIKKRFRFVRRGYSFRATEMEAALGVGQMERIEEILSTRQANAALLTTQLKQFESDLQLPSFDPSIQEHAFMMYPIVIRKDSDLSKEHLVQFLEDHNIETRDMVPLINQPVYEQLKINPTDYPNADWINRCGFYVGCHQGMGEEEVDYIFAVINTFLNK